MKDKKAKPHTLTSGGSKRSTKDRKVTKTLLSSDISPKVVGNFRIIQKLGVGGMGEVYEAEQIKPIRRKVALKLIKWGMDTKQVVARFESERQALALMNHSNIAKVFDAGATEKGRPYFIMECVKGIPITEYCDKMRLDNRKRLELFTQVCDGVQHAHQKGIIHRDIKGSNVLVMIQDEKPVPKIIDFGVAKATAQRLTERTVFTEIGQLIGTPEYMSPEQAEMTGLDVDTRTDVYSLGVLLYELLVGVLPFEAKDLRSAGFDEIRRKVREDEPPKPSTRLTTPGFDTTLATRNRKTDLSTLTKQLKGDLDWIAMKAMAKDRTQRYASVSELAADIGRHLRHEAVLAGPPSAVYRMRKYIRRHKVGVAAAVLVILAVIIGITGTSIGLIKARRAEKVAKEEADTAQQVSNFLVELFKVSDPSEARGNTITAREILDKGAEKINEELAEQPLIQARLMDTMGQVYQNLGLYNRAEPLLERMLEIRRRELGDKHLQVSNGLLHLAWLYRAQGKFKEAESLCRQALDIMETSLSSDHPKLGDTLVMLGVMLRDLGEYEKASPLLERGLAVKEKSLGPDHREVSWALYHLGWLLKLTGEYKRSKDCYERALAIMERESGSDSPTVAWCLNDLAVVNQDLGNYPKAKSLFEQALAIMEKVLGPEHPSLTAPLNNLGVLLWYMGEFDEARPYYERTLEIREKTLGPEHAEVAGSLNNLALLFQATGEYAKAKPLYERALAINEKTFGPESTNVARNLHNLGILYFVTGDYPRANSLYKRALNIEEKTLGPEHPDIAELLRDLALSLSVIGDYEKAKPPYERALTIKEKAFGPESTGVGFCLIELAMLYAVQGKHSEAEPLYQRSLGVFEKNSELDNPSVVYSQARYWAVTGNRKKAVQYLTRSVELGYKRSFHDDAYLKSLHGNPKFEALITEFKKREKDK